MSGKKTLRMIGSSIFQQWGIPNWEDITISNVAIGGTTVYFWALNVRRHLSSEISNYAVYCGSNDLNQDMQPNSMIENIIAVLDAIRDMGQNHQAAYFSIMKATQKKGKFEVIDQINNAIRHNLRSQDLYIEMNSIINQDLKWYNEDKLHLNRNCYAEIENRVQKKISQWAI